MTMPSRLAPPASFAPAPPAALARRPGRGGMSSLGRFAGFLLARPAGDSEGDAFISRIGRRCDAEWRAGSRMLLIGALAAGLWGGLVPLSGAVVLSGSLVAESHLKKIQHPSGGVVAKILARDGDRVAAGDLLLRLDDTAARANLQVLVGQIEAMQARIARLTAERDGAAEMAPPPLADRADAAEAAAILASEESLFKARRQSRDGQRELLVGRIGQLEEETHGMAAQMKSLADQRELITSEMAGVETLYQKKLVPLARLTALQREAAQLDGAQGQLLSNAAETRAKIDEARLQVSRLDQDFRAEVMKDLRESQDKEAELLERAVAARDLLARVEVRAPTAGIVSQSTVHTVGGVVSPGEVLMEIVPEDDALQIEARLSPRDIDQVHVGQSVKVRFPAFNQRTTPEISGQVAFVSADATRDAQSGATFYLLRVDLSRDAIAHLHGLKLVQGMPAEAFLATGDRTMFSYLFKPIGDQFSRVFRER